jgi:hypothetical protein
MPARFEQAISANPNDKARVDRIVPHMSSHFVGQAVDHDAGIRVRFWILLFETPSDRVHRRLHRRLRYLRLSPPNDAEPPAGAITLFSLRKNQRHEDIGAAHKWEMKILRYHAHDHVGIPVQAHGLAGQLALEAIAPQSIADDGHVRGPGPIFACKKIAARNRHNAKRSEEIRAHARALNPLRPFSAGQVEIVRGPC